MASRKRKATWFRAEEEFADRRMLSVVFLVHPEGCYTRYHTLAATHDITR